MECSFYKYFQYQLLSALALTAGVSLLFGGNAGISLFLGCLVNILPNFLFAARVFRTPLSSANSFLTTFFVGTMCRYVFYVVAVAFLTAMFEIDAFYLCIGLIVLQLLVFVMPYCAEGNK